MPLHPGRQYTAEKRAQLQDEMAAMLKAQIPLAAIARRLSVAPATIYIWRNELKTRMVQDMIAAKIRQELVCPCNAYEEGVALRKLRHGDAGYDEAQVALATLMRTHGICYWGEAAARIAESFRSELP
jgi:hypothetical protein